MNYRRVINGLEGCGKSSSLFRELQQLASPEKPIVFAFKNYKLMREQMASWSERFIEPISSFAICGFNNDYQEAADSFTNKNNPYIVPTGAKFIFISQASLQRNKIKDLLYESKIYGGVRPRVQHIVIDEFDFSIGIVPTLDYFLHHIPTKELKENLSKNICDFLFKNYTREDAFRFQQSSNGGDKFNLAYWIEDSDCDITILTSEMLATIFLQVIGFEVSDFGQKTFVDECIVHTATEDNIGRNFFSKMNQNLAWNKLGFNTIISDCIASGYKDTSCLSVDVVSHMGARGSNAYIGKDILTIISYIPKSKIEEIKDCINCFIAVRRRDDIAYPSFSFTEVEALFYRDRMCQAIGRVIGYRGAKETHLLVHGDIFAHYDKMLAFDQLHGAFVLGKITNEAYEAMTKELGVSFNTLIVHRLMNGINLIPYSISPWRLEFDGKDEIWMKIKEADMRGKKTGIEYRRNQAHHKKAQTATNLELYFEKDPSSDLLYADIFSVIERNDVRSITKKGYLQPIKVAKHFGCTVKKVKVKGRVTVKVFGLAIRKMGN